MLMTFQRVHSILCLGLCLLLCQAPCSWGASPLKDHIQEHDAFVLAAQEIAEEAAQIRHDLPLEQRYWVTLPQVFSGQVFSEKVADRFDVLPQRALDLLAQRIHNERDRGYRHWFGSSVPPERYLAFDPKTSEGIPSFSDEIFQRWQEAPSLPKGLPEVGFLVQGLVQAPLTSRGSLRGHPEPALQKLKKVVAEAARYQVQLDRGGARPEWVNQAKWEQLQSRYETQWATLDQELKAMQSRLFLELKADLALMAQSIATDPEAVGDMSDYLIDSKLLAILPDGLRMDLEKRLAGAYFRGAWEAKKAQHDWWERNGKSEEQLVELSQAKREVDLRASYRYELASVLQ